MNEKGETIESELEMISNSTDINTSTVSLSNCTNSNNRDAGNDHWDHTNRKVMVFNMLKFTRSRDMEKLIKEWKDKAPETVEIEKYKKPNKSNWAVVTLVNEDMTDEFIKFINDGRFMNRKGGLLRANRVDDKTNNSRHDDRKRTRGDIDKRNNNNDSRDANNKRHKRNEHSNEDEIKVKSADEVRDTITPLWRMPYSEQLEVKSRDMVNKCIAKIISEVKTKFRIIEREARKQKQERKSKMDSLYGWLKEKRPVEMKSIIAAPKMVEYRNKCELTFGYRHEFEEEKEEYKDNSNVTSSVNANDEGNDDEQQLPSNNKKIFKTPAVGFMAGGWAGGVSSPHCLQNIPDEFCGVTDIFNNFLKTSPIPTYNTRLHRGIWRQVTIRTSLRNKECMIIVTHAPADGGKGKRDDGSDNYTEDFGKEKKRLVKMLTESNIPIPKRNYPRSNNTSYDEKNGKTKTCDFSVTSIFFQEYDGVSNPTPEHPVQHAFGKKFLEEKLLQCTFQISPGAFFQVTTEGAELLYKVVVDNVKEMTTKANNLKESILFDVCCGTGTIGLTCMKEGVVGRVVGIDVSEPAIKDAIINAEKNGYGKDDENKGLTKFIASRAELVMQDEVRKVGSSSSPNDDSSRSPMVIAVVDPARDGLHNEVLKALRNDRNIQRIVYVSCNPTGSLVKDAAQLCSPRTKKFHGLPFKPTSAQPVDMFPLTRHCEMVMVFDRMSLEECDGEEKK